MQYFSAEIIHAYDLDNCKLRMNNFQRNIKIKTMICTRKITAEIIALKYRNDLYVSLYIK